MRKFRGFSTHLFPCGHDVTSLHDQQSSLDILTTSRVASYSENQLFKIASEASYSYCFLTLIEKKMKFYFWRKYFSKIEPPQLELLLSALKRKCVSSGIIKRVQKIGLKTHHELYQSLRLFQIPFELCQTTGCNCGSFLFRLSSNMQNQWFQSFKLFSKLFSNNTMFENYRKSLFQHCERSELRLHFEWTKKSSSKCQKWSILARF